MSGNDRDYYRNWIPIRDSNGEWSVGWALWGDGHVTYEIWDPNSQKWLDWDEMGFRAPFAVWTCRSRKIITEDIVRKDAEERIYSITHGETWRVK